MIIFTLYSLGAASRLMPHHRYFVRRLSKDVERLSTSASARAASTKTTVGKVEPNSKTPMPPVPSKDSDSRLKVLHTEASSFQFDWSLYFGDLASKSFDPLSLSKYWCKPASRTQDYPGNSSTLIPNARGTQYPRSSLNIWVDASTTWGIGVIIGHRWAAWPLTTSHTSPTHLKDINVLELIAIELVIYHLIVDIQLHRTDVRIRGDNLNVLRALMSRTSNMELQRASIQRIQSRLGQARLTLTLEHVASKMNLADPISRGHTGPEGYRLEGEFKVPGPLKGYFKRAD